MDRQVLETSPHIPGNELVLRFQTNHIGIRTTFSFPENAERGRFFERRLNGVGVDYQGTEQRCDRN